MCVPELLSKGRTVLLRHEAAPIAMPEGIAATTAEFAGIASLRLRQCVAGRFVEVPGYEGVPLDEVLLSVCQVLVGLVLVSSLLLPLGLLLSPTPFRRTPTAFVGAIQSLPPELPVTPLDPQAKIPDASFWLRKPAARRRFFL